MIRQFRVLGRLYSSVLGALCVDGVVARLKSFRRLSCLGDHFTTRMATPFTSFRALKTDLSSPYFPCILCEDLFTVSLYGPPSLPLSFYLPLPPPLLSPRHADLLPRLPPTLVPLYPYITLLGM